MKHNQQDVRALMQMSRLARGENSHRLIVVSLTPSRVLLKRFNIVDCDGITRLGTRNRECDDLMNAGSDEEQGNGDFVHSCSRPSD